MDSVEDLSDVINSLEAEFCPPLDSALIAALCTELDGSSKSLEELRETLEGLAAEAIADYQTSLAIHLTSETPSRSESTSGLPSGCTSSSGLGIVESPLAFLRAAFPELPVPLLQEAINGANVGENGVIDMQSVVDDLLSTELLSNDSNSVEGEWTAVMSPKSGKKKEPKNIKGKKIILGDVRQRGLATPRGKRQTGGDSEVDPWSQLTSLADYISTLIPISSGALLSKFHSPDYSTAFDALASQISTLPATKLSEDEVDSNLITMMEIMTTGEEEMGDVDAQWARKCVQATNGRLADAMDLYRILGELMERGPVEHLKPPDLSNGTDHRPTSVPVSPRPAPAVRSPTTSQPPPKRKPKPKQTPEPEWQLVEKRSPRPSPLHPHAEYIPAYRNFKAVPSWTVKSPSLSDEISTTRAVEQDWRDRRREALRKASEHWQRGQDGYGRAIAGFYAEEANRYLVESRDAAIEVARAMVVMNRAQNKVMGRDTRGEIDLHGMTREQALVIVREALAARSARKDATKDEPLRFITGKGNHSAGKQSVLSPALQKALRVEGWSVREIEAGIVVYGKV